MHLWKATSFLGKACALQLASRASMQVLKASMLANRAKPWLASKPPTRRNWELWKSTFAPTLLDFKDAISSRNLPTNLENHNDHTPCKPLIALSDFGKDTEYIDEIPVVHLGY